MAGLALIILLPILVRLPAWGFGLRESPIWSAAALTLPGSTAGLPGLPGFLDLEAGWTTQALGGLAAREWLSGHVPWWNPFSGVGLPLAAEMQGSALFLPYVLLLALPGGTVLLTLALQWTGGVATWRLLRRLDLGRLAAVTGAAAFELGACYGWMGPPLALPVAFLPLFLLGIERARSAVRTGRGGGWRIMAAAVAFSLYAGFPETALLDGLLALAWAVFRCGTLPGLRVCFALRVVAGGLTGLLLAAPALWSFADLLRQASLGSREVIDMSVLSVPPAGRAMILTPYVLGLPGGLSAFDPSGGLVTIWGRAGGYLGMALALAALLGGLAPGPDRGLRRLLLGAAGLFLARLLGLPGASLLFQLVPGDRQIQVFRYSEAAWQLPCCILAAYALDARHARSRVWAVAGGLALAAAVGAWVAWPTAQAIPTAPAYVWASLAWGAASLVAAAVALQRGRPRVAAAVLLADLSVLFALPLAAGVRHARLDRPAIAFLQRHLGLQRFATLGPLQPNYGGLFGLASVNHNYLPVPSLWTDHVLSELRPGADSALFTGNLPLDQPGRPTNAAVLTAHLPAYAALGVRYVLAPPGPSPFRQAPPPVQGAGTPFTLLAGETLHGALSLTAEDTPVIGAAVTIGTLKGQSGGRLDLELCGAGRCATGSASVIQAADNQPLEIMLDQPVTATGGLTWTLRRPAGNPVVIWRWAGPGGLVPDLRLIYAPAALEPRRVYADAVMDIYEVPGAAPYWSVKDGGCTLRVRGRTKLDARCVAPATLVRRELRVPGWHARVNGADTVPAPDGPLFQSVALPAGSSTVRFSYEPPGARAFWALFVLGWLGLLPWDRVGRWRAARARA